MQRFLFGVDYYMIYVQQVGFVFMQDVQFGIIYLLILYFVEYFYVFFVQVLLVNLFGGFVEAGIGFVFGLLYEVDLVDRWC